MNRRFSLSALGARILTVIEERETAGSDLVLSGVKKGSAYTMLYRFRDRGLVRAVREEATPFGRPRVLYSLTEKGKRLLDSYRSFFSEE